MLSYNAARATLTQVREGLSHFSGQLVSGAAASQDMLSSMLQQLIVIVDVMDSSTLTMKRENGVYNFNLWVPRPPRDVRTKNRFEELQDLEEEEEEEVSGFARPGVHLM